jgi:hypothetical protein
MIRGIIKKFKMSSTLRTIEYRLQKAEERTRNLEEQARKTEEKIKTLNVQMGYLQVGQLISDLQNEMGQYVFGKEKVEQN